MILTIRSIAIVIIVLLVSCHSVQAESFQDRAELLSKIIHDMTDKPSIKLFCHDEQLRPYLSNLSLTVVNSCIQADVLIAQDEKQLAGECLKNKKSIAVLTHYGSFRDSQYAVGALFWQKGRPTLIFLASRLMNSWASLPPVYDYYIEDDL